MVRANITKSRRPPDELAIEAINERNKYDVELWEYVARLKDEAVVVEK
jgi:hypothetical protein